MNKLNTAFSSDLLTLAIEVIVGNSFGSGIYVEKEGQVFFCTARHVLYKAVNSNGTQAHRLKQETIELKSYPKDSRFKIFEKLQVNLKALETSNMLSYNEAIDLCVFKIADVDVNRISLVNGVSNLGKTLSLNVASSSMVKSLQEIEVGEELYVIGYPKALQLLNRSQPFYDYNLPLARKGITSCMNDYKTFVIDCAVFGGNSGGPVFIADNTMTISKGTIQIKNNRYLIGIAVQYIPLHNLSARQMHPKVKTFSHAENSGYAICISFDELQNEIDSLIGKGS